MENTDRETRIKEINRRIQTVRELEDERKVKAKEIKEIEKNIYDLRQETERIYDDFLKTFAGTDLNAYILAALEETRCNYTKQMEDIEKVQNDLSLEIKKYSEEEEQYISQLRRIRGE